MELIEPRLSSARSLQFEDGGNRHVAETAGNKLRKTIVHASQSYGSRLRAACKDLAPLVAQADEASRALPTVAQWIERRDRAAQRLSGPRFDPDARLTFDSLNRQINEFYASFAALCNWIGQTAETLQGVLPKHEVEQLLAQVDPSEVEATYRAVQQLSERLAEFGAGCDDAETLETTQTPQRESRPRRKHGPAADMAKHCLIRKIVAGRDGDGWRRDKVQIRELAAEMDQQEVPGSSAWPRWDSRPTTWSEAARHQLHRRLQWRATLLPTGLNKRQGSDCPPPYKVLH